MDILSSANIIRQKRKTIKVVFDNFGNLVLYCPYHLSYKKIEQLLQPKINLIRKKSQIFKANQEKNYNILNLREILVLGKKFLIDITNKANKVYFSDEFLFIPIKYYEANKLNFIIKKTLISLANSVLNDRVEKLCSLLNNKPSKVLIGNFKSKWGSCDSFKVIKLNWKLIMLPQELIDFVVYHEFSHLEELNHSKKFYKILENFEPNHKEFRKKLKEYNFLLSLYK